MIPYITLFNKQITMYAIMAIVGILICGFFACYLIKKKNEDTNNMIELLLVAAIGILLGGHILYGITNINYIILVIDNFHKITSFQMLIEIIINLFGGSVFYGGLIGGIILGSIYIKKKKLNQKIYTDICAIIIPLFHMFGRIGCFLSGCCYGIESEIGFTYHNAIIESANNVNRFPIQLVEASYNLILFVLLYTLYKKEKLKGKLIYLYLILYAIARFVFEFFRGDTYRGFLFYLSTSQIISLIILILVPIIGIIEKKKNS